MSNWYVMHAALKTLNKNSCSTGLNCKKKVKSETIEL